jgi:hypothetical protein
MLEETMNQVINSFQSNEQIRELEKLCIENREEINKLKKPKDEKVGILFFFL